MKDFAQRIKAIATTRRDVNSKIAHNTASENPPPKAQPVQKTVQTHTSSQLSAVETSEKFSLIREESAINPSRNLNLIHGMPRSGNATLFATLKNASARIDSVVRAHFLSQKAQEDARSLKIAALSEIVYFDPVRDVQTREILGEFGYLKDWRRPTDAPAPPSPLMMICPFREPVAASLSLRFYNDSFSNIPSHGRQDPYRLCYQPLCNSDPAHPEAHLHWMENWIEHELTNLYGVDLYSQPFDTQKGYQIIERENLKILVITLEAFSHLAEILSEFYQCPADSFQPIPVSEARSTDAAGRYASFHSAYRIPATMARRIYDSKIMRHLYSDESLNSFKDKWTSDRRGSLIQP